ncbi:hypothetical protein NT6N_37440 [Oceaniferula spumae]|uniref:Uncharacterized protein n=1 Tax=Oceaniferula spumae TaxID=2979115 RepID=A0AAT9FS40_9BACT
MDWPLVRWELAARTLGFENEVSSFKFVQPPLIPQIGGFCLPSVVNLLPMHPHRDTRTDDAEEAINTERNQR